MHVSRGRSQPESQSEIGRRRKNKNYEKVRCLYSSYEQYRSFDLRRRFPDQRVGKNTLQAKEAPPRAAPYFHRHSLGVRYDLYSALGWTMHTNRNQLEVSVFAPFSSPLLRSLEIKTVHDTQQRHVLVPGAAWPVTENPCKAGAPRPGIGLPVV